MSVEYTFNASAVGIGGEYTQGGQKIVVPSLASVALASTGGIGEAVVNGFSSAAVTFDSAVSRVSGRSAVVGGEVVFTTESEIVIKGLTVFNKLSVKTLRAMVTSTRIGRPGLDEGTFSINAEYDGVLVDECPVTPAIDDERCKANYQWHHDAVKAGQGPAFAAGGAAKLDAVSAQRGDVVRTSVVKQLPVRLLPGTLVQTDGSNILTVPGLGRIFFGELLVKRGKRRVSLMRIELGRPAGETDRTTMEYVADSGMLSIGSGDGNGEPIWPNK
ncbi:MAG TPA: hypothetical protein VE974_00505 [Thermoanaerobaculia bacterium]|nr:hypothetical protein [Thermoanaerobaculia bacterium]